MATHRPELVGSILPRALAAKPTPDEEVESVRLISMEAHQARHDFLKAGQAFACLTLQIGELQEELMRAAVDMHNAKVRADKAVASVKEKASII